MTKSRVLPLRPDSTSAHPTLVVFWRTGSGAKRSHTAAQKDPSNDCPPQPPSYSRTLVLKCLPSQSSFLPNCSWENILAVQQNFGSQPENPFVLMSV